MGSDFHKWLGKRGVVHEVTKAYTPESNETAERLI